MTRKVSQRRVESRGNRWQKAALLSSGQALEVSQSLRADSSEPRVWASHQGEYHLPGDPRLPSPCQQAGPVGKVKGGGGWGGGGKGLCNCLYFIYGFDYFCIPGRVSGPLFLH